MIYGRLLKLDQESETVLGGLRECLNKYLAILLEEELCGEVIALVKKYTDVVKGIDFEAVLEKSRIWICIFVGKGLNWKAEIKIKSALREICR